MKKFLSLVIILIIIFDFSGCYALRKKFVRKRRKEIPPPLYLDLKEYPQVPTKDMYDQYYLYVRGWLDELIHTIEEKPNAKRQKKSIDEAVMNFEQIMYFYNEEGRKVAEPLYKELISLREEIHSPYFALSGNFSLTVGKIARLKRDFEKNFSYEDALGWIQKQ